MASTKKARAATGAKKTKAKSSKGESPKTKSSKSKGSKSKGSKSTESKGSKGKSASRSTVSSSSPLGMLALHLREQWEKSGRDGLVFLCDNENRAERLGGVIHALDPSVDVLVFPRLNNLPFDGLEPSREIAGRRSSVLRRLAKARKPVFLVSTAEAIMERLPLPASWSKTSLSLKVGAAYSEAELERRLEALGYDLDEEAEYPGGVLFHGKTFEVFPAGALGPFRIEHSDGVIRKIVAVDPVEHEVVYETRELLIDPMSEQIALGGKRGQRAGPGSLPAPLAVSADPTGKAPASLRLSPAAERDSVIVGRRSAPCLIVPLVCLPSGSMIVATSWSRSKPTRLRRRR